MNFWRSDFSSISENLACDEILLKHVENTGEAWLRIWHPQKTAVVLGYANKAESEVNVAYCRQQNIEINRRISGGGTVILGTGCLCYSLAAPIASNTPFQQVATTNRFIMETHRNALDQISDHPIQVNGVTDLSINEMKFSGNSQKRGKHALLFHGTILLNSNLELIANCLRHPTSEPTWREGRRHSDFITNLDLADTEIENALVSAWSARPSQPPALEALITELAQKKYRRAEWKFCRR